MGLMLSLLVTCVGVLEALACWRHFRAGYLPLPVASCADGDAKCTAGSSSSSSDDSGSVRSLGAYYCSDESVSKYGLTPMLSEHRRKQPNHRNDADADADDVGGSGGGGGGCGREGHCSDVSCCAELLLDTLPTIQELAQEPEEEQQEPPAKGEKDSDSVTGLQLHENHFSFGAIARVADNTSELGVADNSDQRRDILDENDNISENWSVGERTLCESDVTPTCRTKPRPPLLHYKAPTDDEDTELQECRTIRSPPKDTVDRVFTVEEIRGGVSETSTNASVGILSSAGTESDVPNTNVSVSEERSKVPSHVEHASSRVEDGDRRSEPGDSESREKEGASKTETQRMSRASQTWAEADALFQKRSPSRSPHRSPQRSLPKKLPKNVDISWPSFTPQPLFRRASGTPSTSTAHLWPPSADKRRASSGDVSCDLVDTSDEKPLRSSSVGTRTRRSTMPAETHDDCPDPWNCEREERQESSEDAGLSAMLDTKAAESLEKQNDGPLARGPETNVAGPPEQDIPYVNTSTKNCHSITDPEVNESTHTSKTKNHSLVMEKEGKRPTTSLEQTAQQKPLGSDKHRHYDVDDQVGPHGDMRRKVEEELEAMGEDESATEEVYTGDFHDKTFATEKSEPRKKSKRSVRISSFEKEDEEKAQRKSHRSKATEQWSDEESDDRSTVSQGDSSSCSQPPGAGEPFWLIFSGEYTKAMSKDWHSGHFSCWQCDESLTGQRYVLRDDHPYCIKCYESVFANVCEECNKIIGIDSKDLSYKEKHWHEACFLCNKCRVSLVDKQFGSKGEKIYCGNCYDSQFASRCDGCGEIFRAGTKKMEYKTRQWHEKCFCCCVCKTPIGTKSFIPREQEIYCATCYEEKFATRCVKCNKIITSGGVTYKNEPWHRECFTCTNCNTSLAGQRFTSRDEKPYCADCYGELFAKRCTACSKPITGIGGTRFISFEDRHWHNDCFICAMCKTSLVGRGFITDADDIICPDCAKQKLM
ncbi:uncharacterized protein LOC126285424 isoform X2 [Schistocerca gregaria]|uniref:uncharacterized protein LOC126285424 isoform X2 n=1 Tax=Schistocerca gregaria TaxID=7010 RepID=UPI00211E0CD7|nr:uncharacterized protein LOC126285424 isoform X2 [Schistocerca gregaria]